MKKIILLLTCLLAFGQIAAAQPTSSIIQKSLSVDATGTSNIATTNTTAKASGTGFFCNASGATPSAVGADGRDIKVWCDTSGRLRVDFATIAGSVIDTNSGSKSGGTMRVVLATDQPALTNKLLVTPDSVALPSNQSVNVSQINGVTTTMGNGASGTGVQRVTIANDSSGIIALTTGAAQIGHLEANQSTNTAQINGVTVLMGNGASGTGAQRVTLASDSTGQVTLVDSGGTTVTNTTAHAIKTFPVDPSSGTALTVPSSSNGTVDSGTTRVAIASNNSAVAGMGVGVVGSAIPANAVTLGAASSGTTGGQLANVTVCDSQGWLNMTSATTTEIAPLVASQTIRICEVVAQAGGTTTMTFKRGTGTNCGTGTTAISPDFELIAQAGFTLGNGLGVVLGPAGSGTVGGAATSGNAVCVTNSGSVNLHVLIRYAVY